MSKAALNRRVICLLVAAWCLIFAGCRTPEQLIDKAVKKDPTILTHTTDTLRETVTIIDSFPVLSHDLDTLYFEKVVREVEYITINNNNGIEIERKKTRQEVRKNARFERGRLKDSTAIAKLQKKNDRLEIRLQAKNENKANRRENRRSWWWLWYILGILTILCLKVLNNKYDVLSTLNKTRKS